MRSFVFFAICGWSSFHIVHCQLGAQNSLKAFAKLLLSYDKVTNFFASGCEKEGSGDPPHAISFKVAISTCVQGGRWQRESSLSNWRQRSAMTPIGVSCAAGIPICKKRGLCRETLALLDEISPSAAASKDLLSAASVRKKARQRQQARSASMRNSKLTRSHVYDERGHHTGQFTLTQKIWGVNYGNRFIPEEWMVPAGDPLFRNVKALGTEPGKNQSRVSLADVPAKQFRKRMTDWLKKTIKEDDFKVMAESGVNVVRLPTGYWNWVEFEPEEFPDGREEDRERLINLQTMSPREYRMYLDKVFRFASKYNIKVLLELHGAPGSQNGEMHSGLASEVAHFDTAWNKHLAISAVANMAKYGSEHLGSLYGIGVLNEPQLDNHGFIKSYYTSAILAARSHLPKEVPVVVFTWTHQMHMWKKGEFFEERFGNVVWDTHIYHFPHSSSLTICQQAYMPELCLMRLFHRRQLNGSYGGLMVGEWSLAGTELDRELTQRFAKWIVHKFRRFTLGSIYWNLDAPSATWSFQKMHSNEQYNIDWAELAVDGSENEEDTRLDASLGIGKKLMSREMKKIHDALLKN